MIDKLLKYAGVIIPLSLLITQGCEHDWPSDPPDVNRPAIETVSPASGSFLAPANSIIQMAFSEEMELGSVINNSSIKDVFGNAINGTWSENGKVASFTPQNPFEELMGYSIKVKGAYTEDGKWLGPAARDKNGNSLYNDYKFNFATGSSLENTGIYFGRGPETDPSGSQKGIGYIDLSENAVNGEINVSTLGNFAPGELRPVFNPSKDRLYISDVNANKIRILNTANNQFESDIDMPIGPTFICFSPNGQEYWVLGKDSGLISAVNTANNQIIQTINASPAKLNSMAINNAGTRGYITADVSNTGSVIIVDIVNKTILTTIDNVITGGQPYAFTNDIFVSQDDSKIYFVNNYASPQVRIINAATNAIDGEILFPAGENNDEWITFQKDNILYAMARWGTGGFKIDLTDNSIKAQHLTEEAGCYLGAQVASDKGAVFAVGNPTWDASSIGIFKILRSSDLKVITTVNTNNEDGAALPWKYMLVK